MEQAGLGGLLFPVSKLPLALYYMSWMSPITHEFNGIRTAVSGATVAHLDGELTTMDCPRKSGDLDIRTVGEEVLVHHPATQKVHILNRTAGQILEMCDGHNTQEQIVTTICDETGADRDAVARDVAAMVDEFAKLGLVTP